MGYAKKQLRAVVRDSGSAGGFGNAGRAKAGRQAAERKRG
jgi:hypothetical protein